MANKGVLIKGINYVGQDDFTKNKPEIYHHF